MSNGPPPPRFGGIRRARTEPYPATTYSYLDDVREEGEGEAEADEDIIARQLSLYAPEEENNLVEEGANDGDGDDDSENNSRRGVENRNSIVHAGYESGEAGPSASSAVPFHPSSGSPDAQQPVPSNGIQSTADEDVDVNVEEDHRARADSASDSRSRSGLLLSEEPEVIGRRARR